MWAWASAHPIAFTILVLFGLFVADGIVDSLCKRGRPVLPDEADDLSDYEY